LATMSAGDPRLIVVEVGGGQTGFDVIVFAAGERAGRSGEVVAIGLFCYPVGEFAGGRERVQAGGNTGAETWASRARVADNAYREPATP
jgi:hypothetical protein